MTSSLSPLTRLPLGAFGCIFVWFIWLLSHGLPDPQKATQVSMASKDYSLNSSCQVYDFREIYSPGLRQEKRAYLELSAHHRSSKGSLSCIYLSPGTPFSEFMQYVQIASRQDLPIRIAGDKLLMGQ